MRFRFKAGTGDTEECKILSDMEQDEEEMEVETTTEMEAVISAPLEPIEEEEPVPSTTKGREQTLQDPEDLPAYQESDTEGE